MNEIILAVFVFGITALIMIGIGMYQLTSKKPVGFYSGEKGPSPNELTDVHSWNKKHGLMWITYGVIIMATYFICFAVTNSILKVIIISIGLLLPICIMITYHNYLIKKYKK